MPRVLFPLLVAAACDAPVPEVTGDQRDEIFHSDVLDDDFVLRVRTPPDLDRDGAYPVVFQLDPTFAGLDELAITAGHISAREADGTFPPTIVVGLDYRDPSTRFRDYVEPSELSPAYDSDHVDAFYRALRDEIVPHVHASLPVDPERRFLVGHSLGGLVALYAAFRHDPAEASLLAGVVVNDPTYGPYHFTWESWHAARSSSLPLRMYRAIALQDGPIQQIQHGWMNDRLAERAYEALASKHEEFATDHGGVVRPGFEAGLDFVLGGVE